MNRENLGLWGAIAGIFLLAILGIRSAANWLAQGTPNSTDDQTLTITSAPANGNRANSDLTESDANQTTGTRIEDSIVRDRNSERINAQTNAQGSQSSNPLTFSPLEEAGTYIQRQKRVERDSFVATTQVEAISLSSDGVAAQSDTQIAQPAPTNVSDGQPSQARPASTAVPALW